MPTADQVSRPHKILLATDLSARCDRAFDRAAALCKQWQASLVVAHALEPRTEIARASLRTVPSWQRATHEAVLIAQRQIREDLSYHDLSLDVHIEEGEAVEFILKLVRQERCEFIVTGVARSETLGRFLLGTTVEKLARHTSVPILVVKTRAREAYRNILVGTDFSDASRTALIAAASFFPEATISLLHAYRPMLGLGSAETQPSGARQLAQLEGDEFLKTLSTGLQRRLNILFEEGGLGDLIDTFYADRGLDLLVMGSKGRSAAAHALIGSTTDRLLSTAHCDVLVVPNNPPRAEY